MTTLVIEPTSGTYPADTAISVTGSQPDAAIFYTLDGSPPTLASKRYRAPIRLCPDTTANGTMRLRAISVEPNGLESPVAAADFARADGISIRFRKPDTWSSAFVHYWGSVPDGWSTQWPGQPMSPQGDGWYRGELPGQTSAHLVFNDAGGTQSQDLRLDSPDAWFVGDARWDIDPVRFSHFLFPGGVSKAIVLSMDDGPIQDRRLVKILERHGIRGTFHLNSGRLGDADYVSADEVASLYAGHEVSTHSVTHPYLDTLSREAVAAEVDLDRAMVSRITGGDVRGHAYPFGAHNAAVVEVLREIGIAYARTAGQTRDFHLPADPLTWTPTCHHTAAGELADRFLSLPDGTMALFFIFGHSWELDAGEPTSSWSYMESLAERLGGRPDIWYATAIEVADYVRAMQLAQPSLADDSLYNPSDIDLWLRTEQSVVRLPTGAGAQGVFDTR